MRYMVFDVESVGLHGEGFAVGWVVVDGEGNMLDQRRLACSPHFCSGTQDGAKWIERNCPKFEQTHDAAWMMRAEFWRAWCEWKAKGAILVADCCWPVEARFLAQCVDDNPRCREWDGPYPLHDLASIILANNGEPVARRERLESELPEHDPLADARQSARLLLEALGLSLRG